MTDFHTTSNNITESRIIGLPTPEPRVLMHRRTFCYEVYERTDGLWDIDAQMLDHKNRDINVGGEARVLGQPLHNMVVRLTLNSFMTIVAVHVTTLNAPYMTRCPSIADAYQQWVGLSAFKGFRKAVNELFSGTDGCTHITELANTLPTVAIQGIGTELAQRMRAQNTEVGEIGGAKPFQLDQCHALSSSGEIAREFYPKWYVAK